MDSHLDPAIEAAALCAFIKERVAEYKSLETQLEECVAALQPGPSGILRTPSKALDEIHEIPKVLNAAFWFKKLGQGRRPLLSADEVCAADVFGRTQKTFPILKGIR
jgi:hypothetical protein